MDEISVQRLHWRQWPELAPAWERIQNRCPDASFFVSREWVDCWLATFAEQLNPALLTFTRGGEIVACCLLVFRAQWFKGIPLRRAYLNCAGEDADDSTCVEYNSFVSLPDCTEAAAQAFAAFLRKERWDELILPGMGESPEIWAALSPLGSDEIAPRPSHYVDLDIVRQAAGGFDSVLSSNTRQQIRRSQKLYEQANGPCTLRTARSSQEALAILKALADLHQAAWQDRGRPGVFASVRFAAFHQRLIETLFDQDRILLVEVSAGAEVIGALYSFLYRGRVYFYQSGFRYTADGKLKPGLLTHYLAIRHCLEQTELREYDFLAGDSQYKRSLATASRPVSWMVVRRATLPVVIFRGLRLLKRTYGQLTRKTRQTTQPARGGEHPPDISVPDREAGKPVGGGK